MQELKWAVAMDADNSVGGGGNQWAGGPNFSRL